MFHLTVMEDIFLEFLSIISPLKLIPWSFHCDLGPLPADSTAGGEISLRSFPAALDFSAGGLRKGWCCSSTIRIRLPFLSQRV